MHEFECIVTIVDGGYSELIVDSASLAGAKGATIINARGSTTKEASRFFKLNIQPDKQIILILVDKKQTKTIVEAISKTEGINNKFYALSFVLPVESAIGVAEIFKQE